MTNLSNLISLIKLLFVKDKELYVYIHGITGFYPRNIELYKLALVHRSKPLQLPDGRWTNNERLEYLGDAVLDLAVADYLYHQFPHKHEGFLTSTRAKIVQRESLNRIGHAYHLDAHVRAATHTTSHNSYINGNALEALVGAFYLDHGYKRSQQFIIGRASSSGRRSITSPSSMRLSIPSATKTTTPSSRQPSSLADSLPPTAPDIARRSRTRTPQSAP